MSKKIFFERKIGKRDFAVGIVWGVILLLLFALKAFDFSQYSLTKNIDQCYMSKSANGNIYIVDMAHERISAVDKDGEIECMIENPSDGSETAWYIDDFSVSKNGTIYISCTEWDGFYLSKEAILKFSKKGRFLEKSFYREYEKNTTNKHRIMGLQTLGDSVSFVFLNENSLDALSVTDGEESIIKTYDYKNAYNEIADADLYNDSFYVLSKRGYVTNLETGKEVFNIENTRYEEGSPNSFDIANDGTAFVSDIKLREVYSYSSVVGFSTVIEDIDTLYVFCDDRSLFVSDYESAGEYKRNNETLGFDNIYQVDEMFLSKKDSAVLGVKLLLLTMWGILSVALIIRLFIILRKVKISSTTRTEIAIPILVGAIILILLSMLLKQFKVSYRETLFDQMSMTAYSIASVIDSEDICAINKASDFGNEQYENVWNAMDKFFFKEISRSSQMYCNILKWDGDENSLAYAVAYYDQSIGTYYPLDEEESAEVVEVYKTGEPVWNEGKEDIAGTFLYIKVPVFAENGNVAGVVSVGMDTYIMDSLVNDMRNNTLLSIVTILFLIIIAGLEVVAIANAKNKFMEICTKEPNRKVLPVHFIRILVFTVFAAYNMSASFLPVYVLNHSDVGLPFGKELVASLPITVNIFILGVMSLFCAKFVRRMGIRKLALLSGLSSFAGNLLILLIPSYYAIFGGLILDGIGVGLMSNAIYIIITYVKNEADRTEGFSTYNAGCISGINFGMMLGAILAVNIGQKYVFLVVAGLWLVIIELVVLICKQAGNLFAPDEEEEESSDEKKNVGILLKDKLSMSFFILIQNPYIVFNSFVFYFVPIFCDENGYNETMTSILLMVYSLCAVYLADVLTKKSLELFKYKSMHIASFLNVAAVVLYAWTQNMPGLVVALLMLGISAAFGKSVQQTYFCELESVKKYGEDNAMGVYNFTENIGESLGPIVFSYLMGAQALKLVVTAFGGFVAGLSGLHFGITRGCKKTSGEE